MPVNPLPALFLAMPVRTGLLRKPLRHGRIPAKKEALTRGSEGLNGDRFGDRHRSGLCKNRYGSNARGKVLTGSALSRAFAFRAPECFRPLYEHTPLLQ